MAFELLAVIFIFLNPKSKLCLYVYYLWKLYMRVFFENMKVHPYAVTGLIFVLLTMNEKMLNRYERAVLNLGQILFSIFYGITLDRVINAGLVVFAYLCLELYLSQCEVTERGEFSFPIVFNQHFEQTERIKQVAFHKHKIDNPETEEAGKQTVVCFIINPKDN